MGIGVEVVIRKVWFIEIFGMGKLFMVFLRLKEMDDNLFFYWVGI